MIGKMIRFPDSWHHLEHLFFFRGDYWTGIQQLGFTFFSHL